MKNNEIYISTDVETDGPIPGPNSMLSLGAGAFTPDGKLISTFSANLQTLPGATPNADTMEWWGKNQEAYDATRKNMLPPKQAIGQFVSCVNKLEGKPVFV